MEHEQGTVPEEKFIADNQISYLAFTGTDLYTGLWPFGVEQYSKVGIAIKLFKETADVNFAG